MTLKWVVLWGILLGGCQAVGSPLDLSTMDPSQDQWRIAGHYSQEAARLRQRAQDMYARALIYERLFGAESEWVSGTRLLAQSYEDAASEHEGLAKMHLELAGGRPPRRAMLPSDP